MNDDIVRWVADNAQELHDHVAEQHADAVTAYRDAIAALEHARHHMIRTERACRWADAATNERESQANWTNPLAYIDSSMISRLRSEADNSGRTKPVPSGTAPGFG